MILVMVTLFLHNQGINSWQQGKTCSNEEMRRAAVDKLLAAQLGCDNFACGKYYLCC